MAPKSNEDDILEIVIRKIKSKKVAETREKSLKSGIKEMRIREAEGKFFLHSYLIPWDNLGLNEDPKNLKKKEIRRIKARRKSGELDEKEKEEVIETLEKEIAQLENQVKILKDLLKNAKT